MRRCLAIVSFSACVLGFRGEAPIDASHDLDGIVAVLVDLPSTPIEIVACDPAAPAVCPATLSYHGRVLATGGTDDEARDHARALTLVFERTDGLASLRADVPLAVRGLVELEIDRMALPGDRDVDVRTDLGDVTIVGVRAAVAVDVGIGDVAIEDGDGGVAVRLDDGALDVRTPGDADLVVDDGEVVLVQTGDARQVHVRTGEGDVRIELADDADLDLDLRADGTIRVTTDTVVAIADGELVRRVGDATTRVEVRAGGDLEIVRRAP